MKRKLYQCLLKRRQFYLLFFILTYSTTLFSQQTESTRGIIKGKVTEESGEALPGVAIRVSESSASATTDMDGNYSLSVAEGTYTVTASYVGFNTSTHKNINVRSGQQEVLNIRMTANTQLKEVVVSYGRQRQREVTGSIATVDASTLQDMPVSQFAQQLQGKLPGVQISQSSGQPGRGMEFRIRGAASLTSSNQPLFVIDGLPITGSINNINPAEIETFTVLKDASATALYGSRAANGVILITTKHAKPGDSKIEFSSNYGVQKVPMKRVPVMMDARGFATYMKERYEDQKRDVPSYVIPADQIAAYGNPEQYGRGTNWFDYLIQSAPIQSYDLTIQSARERSSSTVIAGYQSQEGVVVNTGTKLFSLRLNQDLSIGNKLRVGFNIAPSYRLDHNVRSGTDAVGGVFEKAFESSPLISPFNPDGSYTKFVHSPGMVSYINPLATLMLGVDNYRTTRIMGNAFLNYEILQGLSLKTNLAADKGAETRTQFTPSTISANPATGISSSVDNYSWTGEFTLNYSKTFFDNHNVEALVGYSAQRYEGENNSVNGTGFPNDDVPYIRAATSITAGSSTNSQFSLLSTIARLNYNYKGKYLLQGAVRRDGSSRFGGNRKYGYFPSISAGWILSDENFMQRFNFIDLLKLRASYGVTGNNDIGNFTHIARLGESNYHFNNTLAPGQTSSILGNSELAWERNKQFDIGFDLEVLKSRIALTYDYYHKISDGLIMDRPIPRASGFTTITTNVGEIELWGHEIGIKTTNLTGKLKWNTNFNISIDRNVVNKLVSPGFIRRNNTVTSDYYRIQEGQSLGLFFGFIHEGLYKDAADLASSPKYGSSSDVGTLKMRDISGPNGVPDGVISDLYDRTFIGDPTPDFLFGLTNDFRYKNFDFSISMAGSVGNDILSAAKWAYQTNLDGSRVMLAAAADRWRSPENPGSGVYPRTKHGTTAIGRSVNSQWVEDGSFLTAKNISLGYTFNLKNNLLLKGLRVYGSVQQAFVITGFSGMNPEINNQGLDPTRGIGVDENAYPIPRTFSIGLSTTFK